MAGKNKSTDPEDQNVPEWLQTEPDALDGDIDALIAEAEASTVTASEEEIAAAAEVAQWSSSFDDPARELRALERVRETLKQKPKNQLKPGQFAAVKRRIAALKQVLNQG